MVACTHDGKVQVLEEADDQTRDGRLDADEFVAAFAWHAVIDRDADYARARRRRRRTERRVMAQVRPFFSWFCGLLSFSWASDYRL